MLKVITALVIVLAGSVVADSDLDLWIAAKEGDFAYVEAALAAGGDPDWINPGEYPGEWSALHWASIDNNPAIVSLLLDSGANVDKTNFVDTTPLMLASQDNHVEVMEALLEATVQLSYVNF